MATTTTNLGLTLPAAGEKVSRQTINNNMVLIDNAFADLIAAEESNSSESITLASGSTGHVDIPLTKTGYTLIGIVSVTGSGNAGVAYSDWYLVDGGVRIYYSNPTSSSKTFTLKAKGIFLRTFSE